MSDPIETLTQTQQQTYTLIQNGGASYEEIAGALDCGKSTARDHVSALKSHGLSIGDRTEDGRKIFYHRASEGEHPNTPDLPSGPLKSKAAITKSAKETVHGIIQHLQEDLHGRAPSTIEGNLTVRESHEDMVVHRSDDHIGAKYVGEFGDTTFDTETAIKRVREVSDKAFRLKKRQEEAGIDFDTLHILLGGDHMHGVGIYGDQPWETELSIPEQLSITSDLYMEFIDRASSEFDTVQLVCQRGNHGELRGDGMGPDDNVDDAFFMTLDKRIRDRGYENVRVITSAAGYFTNFPMRGETLSNCKHRGHLRHGQNSLLHIGTSSGKKRWHQWLHQHDFDIAYRGHYHEFRYENIASKPVIMSGAIVPPSDFEESLAVWSEPAATVHGVSDERPVTWFYPLDFE